MQKPISISALVGFLLALAACHHRTAAPAGGTRTPLGMVVSHAWLVLPAVPGHPGAAYFTLGNEGSAPATLVGVDIVGARQAEIHQTTGGAMARLTQVRIDPGRRVIFAPAGKHVMAFGIGANLAPRGTSAIIFHFQDGKTTSAPLRIEAAGDSTGGMAGMDMGGAQ